MVERLTYRRHVRYNTKSNKQKIVRTPGGKLVYHAYNKSAKGVAPSFPIWALCAGLFAPG